MFDQVQIKQNFMGLVGLRQNDNPAFPQLPSTLLYTGSNVLIDHNLINIENLDMCARNYALYAYPAWSSLTTYGEDTPQTLVRVKYNNVYYRSKEAANLNNQPDTSPVEWEVVNLLGAFLEDVFQSSNQDTVVEMFNRKKLNYQIKTLLRSLRLFDMAGTISDLIINEGDLVGLEIKLKYNQNIVAAIEKVGLQLSMAQSLTLRLYHSSQYTSIATLTVNHTKQMSFQWHTSTLELHYNDPDLEPGGVFYLMYDQADLVGQAIKKQWNFDRAPCGNCNGDTLLKNFNLYTKYLMIRTVRVRASNRNGVNLWDITRTEHVPDNNFGLNLEWTVRCDLTQYLITQKKVFQYAIRDMVTFKLLQLMANNTRQNGVQTKVDALARAELQAKYVGGMGFTEQLDKQIKGIDIEISELDATCMPCSKQNGLTYGSFGLSKGNG